MAAKENMLIQQVGPSDPNEILGVNDRSQLASLERFYQRRQAEKLMQQGTTLSDPDRFDCRGELIVGKDVSIDINVIIEGRVTIGNHCVIGPNTILCNTTLADHVEIKANSVIEGAMIADHCVVGPFARIRPGTVLANNVQIGNFIEIKNSYIGHKTKIHHVGYIGDSDLGKEVNIGAGVITCNYDGVNKHKTMISDYAFIGSNSELVAPVTIGEGATIGAGSTIRYDAPAHQLTVSKNVQRSIENWRRQEKKEKT
jgi:bifunctional UDP-N-acetylglucosamine pyrophosphorylase/glucosamine-1-phosphate N-acetyltransferase